MRYQRYLDSLASPRFARGYFRLIGIAAIIGLLIGIAWTIAGLLHFHPLW